MFSARSGLSFPLGAWDSHRAWFSGRLRAAHRARTLAALSTYLVSVRLTLIHSRFNQHYHLPKAQRQPFTDCSPRQSCERLTRRS